MDSILNSIKKLLGITEEYKHFDDDLIMHINSVFMILTQLGVGPSEGFKIIDDKDVWSEYIEDDKILQAVKTYVYQKVKLMFDPPLSSAVMDCITRSISELEWRLNVEAETPTRKDEEVTY